MPTVLLVRLWDPEQPERNLARRFGQPIITIGRGANNDIPLAGYGFVSTRHAEIQARDGQVFLCDPGSLNGTRYGGQTIARGEALALTSPARFEIGRLVFEVAIESAATPPSPEPRAANPIPALASNDGVVIARGAHPSSAYQAAAPSPTAAQAVPSNLGSGAPAPSVRSPSASDRPPPRTAFVDLGRVHNLVRSLAPAHQAYRESQSRWQEALSQGLASLPENERNIAQALLERHFGAASREGHSTGAELASEEDIGAAQRLADLLLPTELHPHDPLARARLVAQTGQVAKLSVDALVKLLRGLEQFLQELGVRLHRPITPLHAAPNTQAALAYLLDPRTPDPERVRALEQVWTELEIHPIALINAVRAGAQAMLGRLDPAEIERSTDAAWIARAQALWRGFVERYGAIAEDEQQLARVLFGNEFCRAYTAYTEELGDENKG